MTGYVSRRAVQPGAQISPTTPLMAVVPATNMWVDANFKETQIANMRIGQPVTITTDIYGDDVKYTGKVVGLDMGTGSAFSLLPAQNATGNWISRSASTCAYRTGPETAGAIPAAHWFVHAGERQYH